MDWIAKKYSTSALVACSGYQVDTFYKHCERHGLFRWMRSPQARGWNKFSIIDLCIARTVVVLTEQGVSPHAAIFFAQNKAPPHLHRLLNCEHDAERYFGFQCGDKISDKQMSFIVVADRETIVEIMAETRGVLLIFDLGSIIGHVLKQINSLEPGTLAITDTNLRLLAGMMVTIDAVKSMERKQKVRKSPKGKSRK